MKKKLVRKPRKHFVEKKKHKDRRRKRISENWRPRIVKKRNYRGDKLKILVIRKSNKSGRKNKEKQRKGQSKQPLILQRLLLHLQNPLLQRLRILKVNRKLLHQHFNSPPLVQVLTFLMWTTFVDCLQMTRLCYERRLLSV
jgi:hypothetical protein